jgi:hypothetical protein
MIPSLAGRYGNPICHTGLPCQATWAVGIGSLESIPGLLKRLHKFWLCCVVLCIAPVKHLIPLQRTYQCINIHIFMVFSVCYMPKFAFRQCFDTMQIFSLFLCLLFLQRIDYFYFSIRKTTQKEKTFFIEKR